MHAAGYYSYKWGEVLAADVFQAFKDAGLDNKKELRKVGEKYMDTFLANGGSKPYMETYK